MTRSTYKRLSLEERKTIDSFLNYPGILLKHIVQSMNRAEKALL